MTHPSPPNRSSHRFENPTKQETDLMILAILGELPPEERPIARALRKRFPHHYHSLEMAAAEAYLANSPQTPAPMPEDSSLRILSNVRKTIDPASITQASNATSTTNSVNSASSPMEATTVTAASLAAASLASTNHAQTTTSATKATSSQTQTIQRVRFRFPSPHVTLSWLIAFAAVCISGYLWNKLASQTESSNLTAAEQRLQLLQNPNILRAEWEVGPKNHGIAASGDVAWDSKAQKGFVRIDGLPTNDPAKEQYQVWIVDDSRSKSEAIPAGLFDVTDCVPDQVFPIQSALPVQSAATFMVTVEKPGGVPVSEQERVLLMATIPEK